MDRETVIIPEKKLRIEKIKKKYKNMQMSDDTAEKINHLEVTNKILKGAAILSGIITVVDFIVPDPVLGLDEVALTAITGLIKGSSSLVENKIDALANEEITQDCEERTNNWCYRAISTPDGNLVESHWDRINRI